MVALPSAIPDATLKRLFEHALLVRIVDDRMAQLQRDGRFELYVRASTDASQVAAAPLRATDWVFPSYREHGVWFWRGYTIQQFVDQVFGNVDDPIKGRQVPVHHSASWLNLVSISSPIATQIPQAVGAAHAARATGKDDVAMVFFGEGATESPEFHVGLNFAGVWKAPVVFVCRNGRTPLTGKALGYGIASVRVDGGDALAVWQTAAEAIDRARRGDGATLIDVLAPNPDDMFDRLRAVLRQRGMWSDAYEQSVAERVTGELDAAVAAAEAKPAPAIETLFDDVYEKLPWHLREQKDND